MKLDITRVRNLLQAKEENTTVAEIVREVVSALFEREKEKDWNNDLLWNMVGSSSSGDSDLSVNHDKYLYRKKVMKILQIQADGV